jgi:hypothetical protein
MPKPWQRAKYWFRWAGLNGQTIVGAAVALLASAGTS